ncbi:ribose import ATP-binding protein RbsA 2 [Spirochaetia bacterium]|nr:ribose import ATP-binding protein RbsA 2 [Spirochaetia bacterium]
MPLLEAKKINISFSGIQILHDVDFEINAGEINCLCGENGAGKSTLVKVFSGINSNYSGDIFIDGKSIRINSPVEAVRHGIYAVQQHRDLAPTLNAVENMFLSNEICIGKSRQRFDFPRMRALTLEYISKFRVEIDVDIPVQNLKVSEQGIIAICKALVTNSKILLIDEASAPLDDAERLTLYKSLQRLAEEGKGIVYITHHLDEVFRIGHTVTVFRDGYNVNKFPIAELDKQKLIASMTGNARIYSREKDENKAMIGDKALEVEHLFAEGLEDINLFVRQGEILGIAGLEGSGKAMIAQVCFGFYRAARGVIRQKGRELKFRYPIDAIQHNIGLVPNNRKEAGLVLCRDIADNIIITHINKYKRKFATRQWALKIAKDYIEGLRIKCVDASQIVQFLSGGNQQKVLVAKWLKAEVDVLFMIEPTEGIDVGARADLYGIFRKCAREDGKAIIIATSDIDELMELSDRIITMAEGRIINEYRFEEADKQTILSDILSSSKAV